MIHLACIEEVLAVVQAAVSPTLTLVLCKGASLKSIIFFVKELTLGLRVLTLGQGCTIFSLLPAAKHPVNALTAATS